MEKSDWDMNSDQIHGESPEYPALTWTHEILVEEVIQQNANENLLYTSGGIKNNKNNEDDDSDLEPVIMISDGESSDEEKELKKVCNH
ncbi:hypothetical protein HK100_005131 [Physocladia obscura]|uniref:Uncharacterized protein n=1 Tax=Physocladia obscura TaxID=109957 RepID=A0AAD5SUA4_9FUNG|nr:hypothetical protein HK100_005131 [Physocladia obscura]